jgi:hypothetical protein
MEENQSPSVGSPAESSIKMLPHQDLITNSKTPKTYHLSSNSTIQLDRHSPSFNLNSMAGLNSKKGSSN